MIGYVARIYHESVKFELVASIDIQHLPQNTKNEKPF